MPEPKFKIWDYKLDPLLGPLPGLDLGGRESDTYGRVSVRRPPKLRLDSGPKNKTANIANLFQAPQANTTTDLATCPATQLITTNHQAERSMARRRPLHCRDTGAAGAPALQAGGRCRHAGAADTQVLHARRHHASTAGTQALQARGLCRHGHRRYWHASASSTQATTPLQARRRCSRTGAAGTQAAAALQGRRRCRRTGAAGARALQARRRCRHAGAADTQAPLEHCGHTGTAGTQALQARNCCRHAGAAGTQAPRERRRHSMGNWLAERSWPREKHTNPQNNKD